MRVATELLGRPLSSKQYEQLKRVMKLFARKKDAPGVYMQGLLAKWTIFFVSSSTTETINASASCILDINKQQPNSLHPGSSQSSNNNPIIVLRLWSLISKRNSASKSSILKHFEGRNAGLK